MNFSAHLRFLTGCLAVLVGSMAGPSWGQTTTSVAPTQQSTAPAAPASGLKDAAKEPLQKGLAAAQQQDWKLAIRYFLEAQKADPDAPQIWFNLGLASSKLPGYELRALAWFQAYLLAVPDGPNTDAIRQQIATLEVAFESRMTKIIDGLEPIPPVLAAAANKSFGLVLATNAKALGAARLYLGDTRNAPNTPWNCPLALDPTVDALLAAGQVPTDLGSVIHCFHKIGYFLEVGDFAGAQVYVGAHPSSDLWGTIACTASDRHDQKALQDALAKVEAVAAHRDDRDNTSKNELDSERLYLAALLFAVGECARARVVAVDLFNGRKDGVLIDLVGLLVAVGENNRADALDKGVADTFRSGRHMSDPCIEERKLLPMWRWGHEPWWGRTRRNYLTDVAVEGVMFHKCLKFFSCSDAGDETQLVEFLRHSKDTLGGSDDASVYLFGGIVDDLARLAEEYRRVHGPYRH